MNKKIRFSIFSVLVIVVVFSFTIHHGPFSHSKENISQAKREQLNKEKARSVKDSSDKKYKIVLDPGHGGKDPGSIGFSGSYEKDFTLSLAKKVYHLLEEEKQIEVYMTRDKDTFLSTETKIRPKYANDLGADLFVSIHANTFTDPSASGTESFYYNQNSLSLAKIMQKHVVEATGFKDRGVKKENYFVLKDTTMPATLLEIGYITNPEDEQAMLTSEFQQSVAESISEAIKEYLKID